jgi:hypothetical protein
MLARNLASAFLELSRANRPGQVDAAIRYARPEGTHGYDTLAFPNQGDAAAFLHAVESTVGEESTRVGNWSAIEALIGSVPGPEDAAREHDHYIYGSPKRVERK